MSIDDLEDQMQYLGEMLDSNNSDHMRFINEFASRSNSVSKLNALAPPGMVPYRKDKDSTPPAAAPVDKSHGGARPKTKQTSGSQKSRKEQQALQRQQQESNKENAANRKSAHSKFVPLYSKDGHVKDNVIQLPGRNKCECQAQKHELVNNCLKCGRVVCTQEGRSKFSLQKK